MTFDDRFAPLHDGCFATFGVDGSVVRGSDPAVAVRVIVRRAMEKFGDHGQVIGYCTMVDFPTATWTPKQGDVLTIGTDTWKVDKVHKDDGFIAQAVMYG